MILEKEERNKCKGVRGDKVKDSSFEMGAE